MGKPPVSSQNQTWSAALLNLSDEALFLVVHTPERDEWTVKWASQVAINKFGLEFGTVIGTCASDAEANQMFALLEEVQQTRQQHERVCTYRDVRYLMKAAPCDDGVLVKSSETSAVHGLQEHQRLELAMASIHEGLWDWPDVESDDMWWSDRYYQLLGYEPQSLPATANWVKSHVHPDDRLRLDETVEGHIRSGGGRSIDLRLNTRDRGYRWFRIRAIMLREHDGRIRGMGTLDDIHEQHETEQELRYTKERLELALDASNDIVWDFYNLKTGEIWFSDQALHLLRIPEEERPERFQKALLFIHPDDRPVVLERVNNATEANDQLGLEMRLRCGDNWRWFNCVGRTLRDEKGVVSRLVGTLTDIHDRKTTQLQIEQANERLEQRVKNRTQELEDVNSALREALKREAASSRELALNERRLRMLTEAAASIIWTTDKAGNFVEPQPSWQEYTGQSEEDAAGLGWHRMIHEDDAEHFLREWKDSLHEVKAFAAECRLWCQQIRRYRYFAVKALPLLRGEASVLEWVGSMTDIQAQKDDEKQLRNYARELQARNDYLQEFAYAASHDLREPLRKIQAYSNLFNEEFGEGIAEEGRGYLTSMQRAAERMEKLIDDLLQYSRASTASFEPEQVDLQQILGEVYEVLEFAVREAEAQITIGELPSVPGQPTLLRQLFQNLISNALKYRRNEVPPRIEVLARTEVEPPEPGGGPKAWHVITVRDNGIGFDPKHAERIFKPFRRLHTRQQYEGTGIGLAICRRIVERHRGRIEATGRPDQGATFTLHLPAF
ncbi:MAG: PAS domain-containing protein [Verrucomicrobiota bacterium JB022]|nr:PAS domain-containing protein [Verrucomicrobiota bacterium JB022]